MSYQIEKDWVTSAGLRAVVTIGDMGYRCGYVGVPESSPSYGHDYKDVDVEVHGGLTYADGGKDYPVDSDLWWFGYDCAHLYDARDPVLMSGQYKKLYDKGLFRGFDEGEIIRSLEYCIGECESLAKQLSEVTA
jgi:hypothetical protein